MAPNNSIPVPAGLVKQIIIVLICAALPTGAFTHASLSSRDVAKQLSEVVDGQHKLEEKFARLEGSNNDGRIHTLEEQVQTLREHVAGLLAKERSK